MPSQTTNRPLAAKMLSSLIFRRLPMSVSPCEMSISTPGVKPSDSGTPAPPLSTNAAAGGRASADDLVDPDLLLLALEPDVAEVLVLEEVPGPQVGLLPHVDLPGLADRLQTLGHVHRVPEHGELHALGGADVADDHPPAVHPAAGLEPPVGRERLLDGGDLGLHGHRRPHRLLAVVAHRGRRAEHR